MLELFCFQAKNVWSTPPQNESKFNQVWGPNIGLFTWTAFCPFAGLRRGEKCATDLLGEGAEKLNSSHFAIMPLPL